MKLKDLWPADAPHLAIGEVAEWFSAHAYMPKLRDRVVLETSIREAIGKFDASFGYAEGFDNATGRVRGLIYAKAAPEILSPQGLLVRDGGRKAAVGERAPPAVCSADRRRRLDNSGRRRLDRSDGPEDWIAGRVSNRAGAR